MKEGRHLGTVAAIVGVALFGCAPKTTTIPPPAVEVAGDAKVAEAPAPTPKTPSAPPIQAPALLTTPARWMLIELRGKPIDAGSRGRVIPYIVFEKDGGRVQGSSGCNNFAGTCEYRTGDRLRFIGIIGTKKACGSMEMETDFLKVLETTDNYFTDGKTLKLHRARMAPLAVFEASTPSEK